MTFSVPKRGSKVGMVVNMADSHGIKGLRIKKRCADINGIMVYQADEKSPHNELGYEILNLN